MPFSSGRGRTFMPDGTRTCWRAAILGSATMGYGPGRLSADDFCIGFVGPRNEVFVSISASAPTCLRRNPSVRTWMSPHSIFASNTQTAHHDKAPNHVAIRVGLGIPKRGWARIDPYETTFGRLCVRLLA